MGEGVEGGVGWEGEGVDFVAEFAGEEEEGGGGGLGGGHLVFWRPGLLCCWRVERMWSLGEEDFERLSRFDGVVPSGSVYSAEREEGCTGVGLRSQYICIVTKRISMVVGR